MEYCEEHGLMHVGQLVREALAEHGREQHEQAGWDLNTKEHEGYDEDEKTVRESPKISLARERRWVAGNEKFAQW